TLSVIAALRYAWDRLQQVWRRSKSWIPGRASFASLPGMTTEMYFHLLRHHAVLFDQKSIAFNPVRAANCRESDWKCLWRSAGGFLRPHARARRGRGRG